MQTGICDVCHQFEADLDASKEACYSCLLLCGACREERPRVKGPRYYNGADLAEDSGVFDPEEEGYTYVKGRGWTRG